MSDSRRQVVPMRLKLLIDTRSNTVVYAEVCKRFVDHLFQMLNLPLPLGEFAGLMVTGQVNGSLGNLITSIQDLINSRHIVTNEAPAFFKPLHRPKIDKFRTCADGGHIVVRGSPLCPDCHLNISATMRHVSAPTVKVGSYMVTDDLVVKPMSSTATLFNRLSLNEVGVLEERVVDLVINQDVGDKLLHAAFNSNTVLTDVFILAFSEFRWFEFLPPQNGGDQGMI